MRHQCTVSLALLMTTYVVAGVPVLAQQPAAAPATEAASDEEDAFY